MAKIKRILIANRGEIAVRAIRTIKELGYEAVSVYSTADVNSPHVKLADLSICIGPDKALDSYLNIPAIISAAEISGSDSIFPGYGFLSENAQFVEICNAHNINFMGPSSEVMNMMADKSKAKDVMKKANIPTVPGSDGIIKDMDDLKKTAKIVGYPLILKASAGGGGRGMRLVNEESEIEEAFLSAESESISAFGDGSIYMEKFVENPRHIEVQVIGDMHGNVIHLGERDCSMQRRHQKLIEETPAIILKDSTRKKLHETAVKAAKAIGYYGAGTFEFLLDKNQNFYFMELNTRLQVEHTVSEMVTNTDVIELMINVAEDKKLPRQEEIKMSGHALECRITAEDPRTFLPSPGKIIDFIAPGGKDVRLDTFVHSNYTVPACYDSMIAKLVVYAATRDRAIAKMKVALNEFSITGIKTTIDFHKDMMTNEDFVTNNFNTKYLDEHKK